MGCMGRLVGCGREGTNLCRVRARSKLGMCSIRSNKGFRDENRFRLIAHAEDTKTLSTGKGRCGGKTCVGMLAARVETSRSTMVADVPCVTELSLSRRKVSRIREGRSGNLFSEPAGGQNCFEWDPSRMTTESCTSDTVVVGQRA